MLRPADDIRTFLTRAVGLPWGDGPIPARLLADRFGWKVDRYGVGLDMPYPWHRVSLPPARVSGDVGDRPVPSVQVILDHWTPAEGSVDGAPLWLLHDSYLRAVDLVGDVLGRAPDAVLPAGINFLDAVWRSGPDEVRIGRARSGVRLRVGQAGTDLPATGRPPAQTWAGLADALAAELPRLHGDGVLLIAARGQVDPSLTIGWSDGGAAVEMFGADPAVLTAAGWGPTGVGAGSWLFTHVDADQCRAAAAACTDALRAAGVAGPDDLEYQAWEDRYPGGAFDLRLGLAWRPAPETLWQPRGGTGRLPVEAPEEPPHQGGYQVTFDQRDADVYPVALTASVNRRSAAWTGDRWVDDWVQPEDDAGLRESTIVDRLTAERVALVLSGQALADVLPDVPR